MPPPEDAHVMERMDSMAGMEHTSHTDEMKHSHPKHGGNNASADPFGGPYKSMGADCGSWILCPASSPHEGYHATWGDWDFMVHGMVNLIYTAQPGPRGESGFAAPNHFMAMADHELWGGNIRVSVGASFDAFTESVTGKPQLLQNGEMYNGQENVDNQHRHPLITNLSATYVHPISFFDNGDWFCSAALVGDVSGVPMEYHRASAKRFADVSLFHHGTTDKHIASSVLSCGVDYKHIRIAVATFHGQEPGSNPYAMYIGAPDSFAVSFQYLPTKNWALFLYYANIRHAERSEPGDIKRFTAGVMYTLPLEGENDWWATTAIFTHDEKKSGSANMLVTESTLKRGKNYFYGRLEAGQKPASLLGTNTFGRPGRELSPFVSEQPEKNLLIGAGTVGYARTLWERKKVEFGIGADVTGYVVPNEVKKVYGSFPISGNVYLYLNF
jgi:hypothetical protein